MWSDLGSIWCLRFRWQQGDGILPFRDLRSPAPHAPFLFFHHDERWTVSFRPLYLPSFRFQRVIVAHWRDKPRPSLLMLGWDIVSSPLFTPLIFQFFETYSYECSFIHLFICAFTWLIVLLFSRSLHLSLQKFIYLFADLFLHIFIFSFNYASNLKSSYLHIH